MAITTLVGVYVPSFLKDKEMEGMRKGARD